MFFPLLSERPKAADAETFDPTAVTGLFEDMDPGSLPLADGNPVGSWSGTQGEVVLESAGAARPTYRAGVAGGRPAVRFAGGQSMDSVEFAAPLSQPTVIFLVCSAADPGGSDQRLFDGTDTGARNELGTQGINYLPYAGSAQAVGAPLNSDFRVVTAIYDGPSSRLRVNGVAWAGAGWGSQALSALRLGADAAGAGVANLFGDIARLLIYNRGTVLTEEEMASVESGLGGLYGADASGRTDTFTAGGQSCQVAVPPGYSEAAGAPLVLYHHGAAEDQTGPLNEYRKAEVIQALLDAGYLVASSNAHGNNWGNQAAADAMEALRAYCVANYTVTRAVILAQSMGGLSGLLGLAADPASYKGFCGIYPAANLAAMYAVLAGTFAGQIDSAYGIDGGHSYATQTAGHDPLLLSADAFGGLRYRWYASGGDTIVEKADNADQMKALIDTAAVPPVENVLVACSGDHGDPSHFLPAEVVAFFGRCT